MEILKIIIFAVITLIVYYLLNRILLRKIKINKWIVLLLALVSMIIPIVLKLDPAGFASKYIFSGMFLMFFLWFLDLIGLNRRMQKEGEKITRTRIERKKRKNDIIRPKAKPNRVKNK
ncbi:hypothetical protein CLTEP_25770 [Clostridium tepidiprofundi DSM 19306]|uniref:DUF2304 domain-containing protein n=1 Tax=Clostridium tepidiprofundi DSM 19306 TaxID=1121338 RepID=A0A151AT53_9CLOT|nr:hypothetical protein [Clostridium tepidiprofundi]KYH30567.1 hypothetical protein CLTEP_25770 [Clostridium tepidiprofundi DSM 19306]